MNGEVARLRASVAYRPTMIEKIDEVLRQSAEASVSALRDSKGVDVVRRRLADPALRVTLETSYDCIRLLVGSELDTHSSGERGLGRTTAAFPRLGGRFGSDITPGGAARLGPVLEELCIGGFGACAVYDALVNPTPTVLRTREQDDLLAQWVSRCIGTWAGWSSTARSLVEICSDDATSRLVAIADDVGMTKGLRSKSKRDDVRKTAIVLASAGLQLFVAHTPSSDDWFRRA